VKVLVTGGAGYLGSVIVPALLDAGHTVRVMDIFRHGVPSLLAVADHPRFELIAKDARDEHALRSACLGCDAIVPLAAVVGASACDRDPGTAETVNLGAIRLLNSVRLPTQWVIYPTTNSGYGTKSGDVFCTEETPLEPISLYGRTKVEAERELLASPNVVTLRLATVFGVSPRMRLDLLVNSFVWEAVMRRYLVIFEGHFKRNYIHIKDVADCVLYTLGNFDRMKGNAFNCGLDEANYSKAELVELIRQEVPDFFVHAAEIGKDPDKRNYIVSNEKLRAAGFQATRSVRSGIRELQIAYQMIGPSAYVNA
jgi:nucleoside-diphosphate-sugar epimerase